MYQCICEFISKKKSFLTKEYDLFVLAWPWELSEFTRMVKTKDLRTINAQNDLSTFYISLNNMPSFMVNIFKVEL